MIRSADAHAASFGLACWHGAAPRMQIAHSHDDVEINLAPVDLEYLIDGRAAVIPAGTLAVFWAARPHQLVRGTGDLPVTWLTAPLVQVRAWSLPAEFLTRLFAGEIVLVPEAPGMALADGVAHWQDEVRGTGPLHDAAALEIEALVRRVAHAAAGSARAIAPAASGLRPEVAAMAAWISLHAADDIGVADVAAQAHLHPRYAMEVFRAAMGVTIGEYIAQGRIARAQHLLLSTDASIADIAQRAGFGSSSQFYALFRRRCGTTPAAYRRTLMRDR
ncbi:helix-turn-helix domain-containing protein [Microbacterium chocolatum]|uniref:helix-turn-helix domain-containing protein n=1 Tax=Microbacterium aurantiacum TaxID=162393 RepID=UPI00338D43F3